MHLRLKKLYLDVSVISHVGIVVKNVLEARVCTQYVHEYFLIYRYFSSKLG